MPKRLDLAGLSFGRLSVIEPAECDGRSRHLRWLCRCVCGRVTSVRASALKTGSVRSCGCARGDAIAKHGHTRSVNGKQKQSRTYKAWHALKYRCDNPNIGGYKYIGGRGIGYCDRWKSFQNFLEDMGEAPSGHAIARLDRDKDYCPDNCYWRPIKAHTGAKQKRHSHED